MSTTPLRIIELIKSLPVAEQQAACEALAKHGERLAKPKRRRLQRLPDGSYYNPEGIPNDHPIFKILEDIEEERHHTAARPAPEFA